MFTVATLLRKKEIKWDGDRLNDITMAHGRIHINLKKHNIHFNQTGFRNQ